jgi:hypothetical protein
MLCGYLVEEIKCIIVVYSSIVTPHYYGARFMYIIWDSGMLESSMSIIPTFPIAWTRFF